MPFKRAAPAHGHIPLFLHKLTHPAPTLNAGTVRSTGAWGVLGPRPDSRSSARNGRRGQRVQLSQSRRQGRACAAVQSRSANNLALSPVVRVRLSQGYSCSCLRTVPLQVDLGWALQSKEAVRGFCAENGNGPGGSPRQLHWATQLLSHPPVLWEKQMAEL